MPQNIILILCLLSLLSIVIGQSACEDYSDCVSCTQASLAKSFGANGEQVDFTPRQHCLWLEVTATKGACKTVTSGEPEPQGIDISKVHRYADTCSVFRPTPSSFLTNWMGSTQKAIGDLTLLDLSLPGSHDTLTDDLSLIVSDGGIDGSTKLAEIMHDYSKLIPNSCEDYIRQQSQTQDLDITTQLDNGIRFFDLRVMYEYSSNKTSNGEH